MREVWHFIRAVARHWGSLVTGGFLIGLLSVWEGTGHAVSPWVYWAVALSGLLVAFFRAWAEERKAKEGALAKLDLSRSSTPAGPADHWLCLLQERQKLEAELQPLLEIEEAGIKVIPAIKIGKDESDYRREQIERLRRDIEEIGRQSASDKGSRLDSPALPMAADWQKLADRFRKLSRYVRADWQQWGGDSGRQTWSIGGSTMEETRDCKALCSLAGAMLAKSPNACREVSEGSLSQRDEAERWLFFLKERGATDNMGHALETLDNGEKRPIFFGSINNLAGVSSTACIECSAKEI